MAFGAIKKKYVYTDDTGGLWVINIAEDKASVTPSPGLTAFNPASPPTGLKGVLNPKRCRGVHAQGTVTIGGEPAHLIKRFFICGTSTAALYALNISQNVSYTGDDETTAVTLVTTGRKGERFTF